MSNKYTAAIESGIEFPEFVMRCARAFDALASMRDSPLDTPIPAVFESSDYYKKMIGTIEKVLYELRNMTIDEAERAYELEGQEMVQSRTEYNNKKIELKHKYELMLEQVRDWNPPSEDHIRLKEFMIEQIENSIKFVCSSSLPSLTRIPSTDPWLKNRIASTERNLNCLQREWTEDKKRCAERTEWVNALRKSLGIEV